MVEESDLRAVSFLPRPEVEGVDVDLGPAALHQPVDLNSICRPLRPGRHLRKDLVYFPSDEPSVHERQEALLHPLLDLTMASILDGEAVHDAAVQVILFRHVSQVVTSARQADQQLEHLLQHKHPLLGTSWVRGTRHVQLLIGERSRDGIEQCD
eukprot:278524-Hanusia_phi.AAC.3